MEGDVLYLCLEDTLCRIQDTLFGFTRDSSGQWIQMGVLTGNGTPKTEVLNIVPQACDHYALRLEGCGDVRVISIANTMTLGSDL